MVSETLADEPAFPEKELACSVASKVLYYLEEYEEALILALKSGEKFNLNERSKYVDTLIAKCIDDYISIKTKQYEDPELVCEIDPKMEDVINKMFDRCFNDGQFS